MSYCTNCAALEEQVKAATKAMLAVTCGPAERAEWEALVTKARNRATELQAERDEAINTLEDLFDTLVCGIGDAKAATRRAANVLEQYSLLGVEYEPAP